MALSAGTVTQNVAGAYQRPRPCWSLPAMSNYESGTHESDESFNHQHTHQCPHCSYTWQYTGKLQSPSCPSCHGKVPPENRLDPSTEFTIVDLSGTFSEEPRFDVDVTIDTEEQKGEVIVRMELEKAEAESLWEQLQGDGHTYPEDARERVLSALEYDVRQTEREV